MTTEWHERWKEGRLGFHQEAVHTDLIRYRDDFLGDQQRRVLVPLCGKSVDMRWLADNGHQVVGIEFVPDAIEAFFSEWGKTPARNQQSGLDTWSSDNVSLFCADFFEVTPDVVGSIDRVWDRAALVAIEPPRRERYAEQLRRLAPGAQMLLNVLDYDAQVMDGPPYSTPGDVIANLFPNRELLEEHNAIDDEPRWRERGHSYWNTAVYQIPAL